MKFFKYLFYNQYAEIRARGGDARKAQLNMLLLSTAIFTLYILILFILYDRFHPGFLERYFSFGGMGGKTVGRFLGAVIGLILFLVLKISIGTKGWYYKMIEKFDGLGKEEQQRLSKKGLRYFFIVSIPIIIGIAWALISVF